jgi:hypothetical protein
MPWHILRATLGRGLGVSVGVGRGRWVSDGRVGCLGGVRARPRELSCEILRPEIVGLQTSQRASERSTGAEWRETATRLEA